MKYQNISIKKLLSTGPYEHPINFSDSSALRDFLGRKSTNYVSAAIRNKKYIITDTSTSKNYYVVVSYNDYETDVDKKLQKFYDTHVWKNGMIAEIEPLVMPTKEQFQEDKIRHLKVGKLLSLIQVKYGDLVKAAGTPEFLELQKLLNAGWS